MSSFLVLISVCLISSIVESVIAVVGVIIGTAKLLCAITLLKLDNSEDHIFRILLRYSLKALSLPL